MITLSDISDRMDTRRARYFPGMYVWCMYVPYKDRAPDRRGTAGTGLEKAIVRARATYDRLLLRRQVHHEDGCLITLPYVFT